MMLQVVAKTAEWWSEKLNGGLGPNTTDQCRQNTVTYTRWVRNSGGKFLTAEFHASTLPPGSVMVNMVLLWVALMWMMGSSLWGPGGMFRGMAPLLMML